MFVSDHFYPPRASPQSCFDLPLIPKDVTFELNPDYVAMPPKLIGFEDPSLFIRGFEEVCSLIHMPRVSNDVVRKKFILFSLKYDAKRWMYSLKVGSIKSWKSFVNIFLKRHFPTSKTLGLRNEILSFVQLEHKPFWRSTNRFKELLTKCSHYGLERRNFPNCL